VDLAIANAI